MPCGYSLLGLAKNFSTLRSFTDYSCWSKFNPKCFIPELQIT